ncbi:MAG TPA: hypothetical protein VF077_13185 [Nitrospiraceae bacterium]
MDIADKLRNIAPDGITAVHRSIMEHGADEINRLRALCRDAAITIEDRRTGDLVCNTQALIEQLKKAGAKATSC